MKHPHLGLATIILAVIFSLSSCTFLVLGSSEPVGKSKNKDTAKLEIDRKFDQSWSAAQTVIKKMGVITSEEKKSGTFGANVRDAKVTLTVTQVNPKSIRIEVKALKNKQPQTDLSNEIVTKIQKQLK